MLSAIAFVLIVFALCIMALARGPFWALLAYVLIYFIAPVSMINWWADFLPFSRWALLSTAVLLASLFIHRKKCSDRRLGSARWIFAFFGLTLLITVALAVNPGNAYPLLYTLFTYCLIVVLMIKTIGDENQLRTLLLTMVILAGYLSVNAWLHGRRVNDRLEGIGSVDSFGANEFGLLLASLVPFIAVLLINGRKHERIIALMATPFILNAFILCNSRGAAVAFIGAIGLSALIFADRRIRRGLLGISLAAIPVLLWLMDDAYMERITTLLGANQAVAEQSEEELNTLSSGRMEIWGYGMEMAVDHPLGAAPDGFRDLAHLYMPPEILVDKGITGYGRRAAHNTYLQVLVEQGLLGLGVFLGMCVSACLALRRSFKALPALEAPGPLWRNLIFATAVSFLTSLAGGLVTNRVYYEFFWWQLAIVVVVASLAQVAMAKPGTPVNAPSPAGRRSRAPARPRMSAGSV
jgi:putative inorganic carbon (hco3(-)) transporter